MSVFNNQNDRGPLTPERRPAQPGFQSGAPVPPPVTAPLPSSQVAASAAASAAEAAVRKPSVLGKTLVFKGELSADEDLVLQGRVEGSIHHTQSLTVGVDGVVIGDIHARSIVVEGTVEGDLRGSASVSVAATATVRGNIVAPRVGIMEGAHFNGSVDMSSAHAARVPDANVYQEGAHSGDSGLTERSVERILGRS
jgi:cytoskeletal protein CcmA (bactofilin family)